MEKSILIALLLVAHTISAFSQQSKTVRFTSRYTSFPDSGRSNGHTYDSVFYSTRDHYSDSSVLLVVPDNLRRKNKVDLIFWFHGWNNNIDTANQFYELEKQFLSSRRNAILVLSETAKNAPDSYGGKLEQPGDFSRLVSDVLYHLKKEHLVENKAVAGSITLAGHSGAYRVIAYILANGGVPVEKVYLFDALYSQVDKFLSWIQQNKGYRFVNWYTNHGGGTDEVSIQMMQQLDQLHLPYKLVEETTINSNDIKSNRILFVHSPREHNVIINRPDDLRLLLENDEGVKQ
ncbi:MAG: hypothetical protein ACXVBJ_15035 [Flavisolibacter sp.]